MLTGQQKDDFERKARRIIEWINLNGHPHMTIIITNTTAEIVEGLECVHTNDYLIDKL